MKAYRVYGCTGDGYEYCSKWTVRCFFSEQAANSLKTDLENLFNKILERSKSVKIKRLYWDSIEDPEYCQGEFIRDCIDKLISKLDPNVSYDMYLSYGIEELEVE